MGRRGAPKGNQNARKHGFYRRALEPARRREFEAAAEMDGLDDEVAIPAGLEVLPG